MSTYVGDLSAFDMEKYLKKTDLSDSNDTSVAHTTFDLTGWANNLSSFQRNPQMGYPLEQGSSAQICDSEPQLNPASTKTVGKDRTREIPLNTSTSATHQSVSHSHALSSGKGDSRRSSVPRPCASFNSARRSVGSGQSSILKPPADNAAATAKTAACDSKAPVATNTRGSSGIMSTEDEVKQAVLNPQVSNNMQSSLEISQKGINSSTDSSGLGRASPGRRKGQSGLPCLKCSSPSSRSTGQQQHDRSSNSPEVKTPPRSPVAAPPPRGSLEKHVGFSCQIPQPSAECASGELKQKIVH